MGFAIQIVQMLGDFDLLGIWIVFMAIGNIMIDLLDVSFHRRLQLSECHFVHCVNMYVVIVIIINIIIIIIMVMKAHK